MNDTRLRQGFAASILTAAILLGGGVLSAQERVQQPAAARQPTVELRQQPAPPLNQDATQTRRDFYEVLNQYPPGLGRVLRMDPTLMTNPEYLNSYPQVAAFIAQYPDIPRNPGFYLERYDPDYRQPSDARQDAVRLWGDVISFTGAFVVFCVITYALFSLLKYLVEYRRWNRISKVNAEVHNKILDRFASNEEMLAYIDSPAGRRFLEATPIAPIAPAASPAIAAPFGRILWCVQVGIRLAFLALGLFIISGKVVEEVQQLMLGLSVIGFCLGLGFVLSAGASYLLSRKLGLLQDSANPAPREIV
ncbi:hypothetical protein BH18ACI5_BH18ACI5_02180 [soil metagenome]